MQDTNKPGIIFLEIDGLAGRVLCDAMAMGKAPNMKRWLDSGSHKLTCWHSDFSSQSCAAQAGILHGKNFGIPAFRWYDKTSKEVVVTKSLKDVSRLEKQISDGQGLLSGGGAARGTIFSGDANHVLATASRPLEISPADLRPYFMNPLHLVQTLSLMVWEWYLEKRAAWGQRLRNEKPRVNRGGTFFLRRSVVSVFLRDIVLLTLQSDMRSGMPYAYATLAGYDKVSHHSGTRRPDTLEVLRKIDKGFGKLERVARSGPGKYHLVVLSDHGHTQGATFRERYGETLAQIVGRLVRTPQKEYSIAGYDAFHEDAYYIDTSLIYRQARVGKRNPDDVIVLASGNMGLIYFSGIERRVTMEELARDFPDLIPGLITHPGIGFIAVRTEVEGTVAMGKKGKVFLSTGKVEGENPLASYGPLTLPNLARLDTFPNAPDILVISNYWKDEDEVAAFEELVSSHGGVGGEQSHPFILYPAEFELGTNEIIGAEAVYTVFKRWTARARPS